MFKGSNVALVTPFKNNKLDEEAYIKLIDLHLSNGTNGLVPAGTTGESPTLSHDEHEKVIEICIKETNGKIKNYVIEVKPAKQTKPPVKPKRQTKGYIREAYEYAKNQAKWKMAKEFCADRQWEFKVVTEKELGI